MYPIFSVCGSSLSRLGSASGKLGRTLSYTRINRACNAAAIKRPFSAVKSDSIAQEPGKLIKTTKIVDSNSTFYKMFIVFNLE